MIPVSTDNADSLKIMKLLQSAAEVFFLMFVLLKPFYVMKSGSIGAADWCMAAAFVMTLMFAIMSCTGTGGLKELGKKLFFRADRFFYLFLLLAVLINISYAVVLQNGEFIRFTLFWLYNGAAIWTFRMIFLRDQEMSIAAAKVSGKSSGSFLSHLDICLKAGILIQTVIWMSGRGRVLTEAWGATRYQGTFNDPNQLAFFMFASLLLIYLYVVRRHLTAEQDGKGLPTEPPAVRRLNPTRIQDAIAAVFIILATILIIVSKSTGMILGMGIFVTLLWICSLKRLVEQRIVSSKAVLLVLTIGVILIAGLLIMIWPSADFNVQEVNYNTLTRIQEKLWKISNGGLKDLVLDRGADKILAYPQYLLYGAGEGGFERFASVGYINEIHSGILSILFCYGIIPTVILTIWFIQNIRYQNRWQLCAVFALICESFTLINYRQPLFWFVLIYGILTFH